MPELVTTISELRQKVAAERSAGKEIGLVPTMGAFHEGHLSLVRQARQKCGYVVVSIFVNPTQFERGEDLDSYPRNLEKDMELCEQAGADLVFAPATGEVYPESFGTYIEPDSSLAGTLCGASRPGHFRGVCTVVLKLFNEAQPDVAYFGHKDYQQSAVIRKMTTDLDLGLEITVCPTVREKDGLAMSSRNSYLNPTERAQAVCLYKALLAAKKAVETEKITDAALVKTRMTDIIKQAPAARIDYVEVVHPDTLAGLEEIRGKAVAVLAVFVGSTRLIDNMVLNAP
jgi:pantoate--beta-alanine ligase